MMNGPITAIFIFLLVINLWGMFHLMIKNYAHVSVRWITNHQIQNLLIGASLKEEKEGLRYLITNKVTFLSILFLLALHYSINLPAWVFPFYLLGALVCFILGRKAEDVLGKRYSGTELQKTHV
ncbi:hypothetical protein [Listeria fleischmannii]|uniref:hypothetical protein n=1 Tax=Listeria fleischmannii TaxID=1069827 RepID=UPI0016294599|nr:hypothetical protein [Listeria fleischmannii]MBC1419897.1 hypothetical protein [Listeria fleischmannii]